MYNSSKVFPRNMLPADYYAVRVEDAHLPLIAMLVLTQLSVGACFVNDWLFQGEIPEILQGVRDWQTLMAVGFGFLALGASTLHLGRPHLAWRAFLGLRKSWLSREILAFGLFAIAAGGVSLGALFFPQGVWTEHPIWLSIRTSVQLFGLLGVICSVMIYYRTRRPTWGGTRTLLRFLGTCSVLGISTSLFAAMLAAALRPNLPLSSVMMELMALLGKPLIVCSAAKLLYEASDLLSLLDRHQTPLKRMATLLTQQLAGFTIARFALGALGGIVLPWALLSESAQGAPIKWLATVTVLFGMTLVGEFLERTLFFMTAVSPRMPGAVRS